MKLLVVLALIAVALAQNNCAIKYTTQDNAYSYNIPAGWFNATDQEGYVWYFNTCPVASNEVNPCSNTQDGKTVSVCRDVKEITYPKGTHHSMIISDSPYGNSNGVEIMYGLDSKSVKTVVELVCSTTDDNIVVKVVDESTTIITFNSKNNCPLVPEVFDGIAVDSASMEERTIVIPGAFIYFLFLCTSLLCVCCCCTCLIRRKRQQQRKDIQMKQFSSVAFQPIPANTAAKAASAPQATYNPYVPQPQFVYYYPSQNGSAPEFPLYTQTSVENTQNDENMARDLQAQFDQEHV